MTNVARYFQQVGLIPNPTGRINDSCEILSVTNVTSFLSESDFRGIPENLLIGSLCFLVLFAIFLTLNHMAWQAKTESDHNIYHVKWFEFMYTDMYEFINPTILEEIGCSYKPIHQTMTYVEMLRYSFFGVQHEDLKKRCGIDAIQYLYFLKHLIAYNIVNTIICLTCVLPANLQGDFAESLFRRTTIGNLDPHSPLLWIHVISSAFLSIVCYALIRNYSRILNVCSKTRYADRTIIIKRLQEEICSSEKITEYFNKYLQKDAVQDVKLVYQYRPIIILNRKLRYLEEILEVCNQVRNTEFREVMVKRKCWCCLYYFKIHCNCEQLNGIQYYTAQINLYRKSIAKELNVLPKKILPMAFVSFSQEHLTRKVKEWQKRLEYTDPMRPCLIESAPNPNNILWENMKHLKRLWDIRTMTINTGVLLVALFLTTPAVIIASLDLDRLANLSGNSTLGSVIFSKVLPTILAWSLSMSTYLLVTNSSQYLHFGTKSAMCRSIMKKTFSFLVLTVIILPCLGLTSLSAFIAWTVSEDSTKYRWGCVFLPDNGAFFVGYVIITLFIGCVVELIRIPDVLFLVYQLFISKSEAENVTLRKDLIVEFAFGVQYSRILLIFTLVSFFSFSCPLITPFGLMYFIAKYIVDRYNIFFVCSPSRASYTIHGLALKLALFTLILMNGSLHFIIRIRGDWRPLTSVSSAIMWLFILICLIGINPLEWKLIPRRFTLPHVHERKFYKMAFVEPKDLCKEEIYQPFVLRNYIQLFKCLDKYKNPLPHEKETDSKGTNV